MSAHAPVLITAPSLPSDYEAVKALFVEYGQSLGFSLAYQEFEAERWTSWTSPLIIRAQFLTRSSWSSSSEYYPAQPSMLLGSPRVKD
jgi:hypothetical protein